MIVTYRRSTRSQLWTRTGGTPCVSENFRFWRWILIGPGLSLVFLGLVTRWTGNCWPSSNWLHTRTWQNYFSVKYFNNRNNNVVNSQGSYIYDGNSWRPLYHGKVIFIRSKLFITWHKSIVSSDWSDTMVWFGQILLYLSFTILYAWSLCPTF